LKLGPAVLFKSENRTTLVLKEGKNEGKRRLILQAHHMPPFSPPPQLTTLVHAPALELALPQPQLPYPKNSHTTSFPPSSHHPSNLTCFFFPPSPQQHINPHYIIILLQLCTKFQCCYSWSNFLDCVFGVCIFCSKVLFLCKFAVAYLFVCFFFDLLAADKLLQVHSNSTEL
jgi:hypothetical protein